MGKPDMGRTGQGRDDVCLKDFAPLLHARAAFELWERTLGAQYPVSERVFLSRAVHNPVLEPGDGLVALAGRRLVGFALAEVGRTSSGVRENASVAAILVDPQWQRHGVGTLLLKALENRVRACGCRRITTGMGVYRFWTGIPEDLPGARAFFARHGYCPEHRSPDMTIPLGNYAMTPELLAKGAAASARVTNLTPDTIPAFMRFQQREFPGWCPNMVALIQAGDIENILAVVRGDEVIGSISCFTPGSRYRGSNLVWERCFSGRLGGYGAVGIAKDWRGKGLGALMSRAAAVHVQSHGADICYIDWVGPVDFYRRLGADVWRWFDQLAKKL
ncbi:MAG: Mycothiol acetyltransferase [Lentisphaerae bacterium ADurb.BinA184]|nr:MAG: Mycothiol acetyltransferase [Lentisphaerae bacterium ADurb.BinA184]